jgi:hypothetical protein
MPAQFATAKPMRPLRESVVVILLSLDVLDTKISYLFQLKYCDSVVRNVNTMASPIANYAVVVTSKNSF